jgi:acyl carrier protein
VIRQEVVQCLVPIMEDTFNEDNIAYSDNLTADDIEDWDSLSHIRFMVAIEKEFGVRFTSAEIEDTKNVGELVDLILAKLN